MKTILINCFNLLQVSYLVLLSRLHRHLTFVLSRKAGHKSIKQTNLAILQGEISVCTYKNGPLLPLPPTVQIPWGNQRLEPNQVQLHPGIAHHAPQSCLGMREHKTWVTAKCIMHLSPKPCLGSCIS